VRWFFGELLCLAHEIDGFVAVASNWGLKSFVYIPKYPRVVLEVYRHIEILLYQAFFSRTGIFVPCI
jgi:hypothetical protein